MHWLAPLQAIGEMKSIDLREMAKRLDRDPATFYRGQDMAGCDLRGQNLDGMDLTDCNIGAAIYDDSTVLPPIFDPRRGSVNDYVSINLSRELNNVILNYAEVSRYGYPAWAFKHLLDFGIKAHAAGQWPYYRTIVDANPVFKSALNQRSKSSCISRRMQIYDHQQRYVTNKIGLGLAEDRFAITMLVGLLSQRIPPTSNKDYSGLTFHALVGRVVPPASDLFRDYNTP